MRAPAEVLPLSASCLSIDLEVGKTSGKIHQFAVVRGDNGKAYTYGGKDIIAGLREVSSHADGLQYLLGHNLIAFDVPHLRAVMPSCELLGLPVIDTLRLNPLAFPRNPYHYLVKHYQDGQIKAGRLNDPELDARLTLNLFQDQCRAFETLSREAPPLLAAYHWLTSDADTNSGFESLFASVRKQSRPDDASARSAIASYLREKGCCRTIEQLLSATADVRWEISYVLAWLSVAGGNSVVPPWVRNQFPQTEDIISRLRDTSCHDSTCPWCSEKHNAVRELGRWFPSYTFRPEPSLNGQPLQKRIVECAMAGEHALGILPTGTGKSLCYQIPALSKFDKTGALTIVISPLVALMEDQVAGLEKKGITSCVTVNGLLSLPERTNTLDRIRMGEASILIIAPEQLRSRSVRTAIAQRRIGLWVIDEAHCLSKWGHDFRPDYRYITRVIRKSAGESAPPPVLCLTATAKPEVVDDIVTHFKSRLAIDLSVFNGGAERENLKFSVLKTSPGQKFSDVYQSIDGFLPAREAGGVIVYCATRNATEELADYLRNQGMAAEHFHAKLLPEEKKRIQGDFINGALRVITATNAFGMGIDKPDVRLVVHADIPGSLENYIQEAGRAGRDRAAASCVLLFTLDDVEKQFSLTARARLTEHEIQSVYKALQRLGRRKKKEEENEDIVATTGEILAEDEGIFQRDQATDDTRVRTAVAWLEEAELLVREENHVQVFPSSLRVASVDEARKLINKGTMREDYAQQLLRIVQALIEADSTQGVSTDDLMGIAGLSPQRLRNALYDLERLGIASNDTVLTAYVHMATTNSSVSRLEEVGQLEKAFIRSLREHAPDLDQGQSEVLHMRHAAQRLKDEGERGAVPDKLWRLLRSLANDGKSDAVGTSSIDCRRIDAESARLTLRRTWSGIEKMAEIRRVGAKTVLEHLTSIAQGERRNNVLVETTLGKLLQALRTSAIDMLNVRDPAKLLDYALLWLHEQDVIRLNKGLAIFRPAMTVRLMKENGRFGKSEFQPLALHYKEKVLQVHVMAEYARRGLESMTDALSLVTDYFSEQQEAFLKSWLPGTAAELGRETTPTSWANIVESLNNKQQRAIVADDRTTTNVLVLAGPGAGKTRVLVHRIAYLLRVKRENPRGILALAYNRHAAVEIRRRLSVLVGDDAVGVTVLTCDALAMRLVGRSFIDKVGEGSNQAFREIRREAVALLNGEGLAEEEADEQRTRLMAGFRWILVDEYQDIEQDQYDLISALTGRTRADEDGKLNLLAVGDDDQNIYTFNGASVEFIRRFQVDYHAQPVYLIHNYRSTQNIITVANQLIEPAAQRMKAEHAIEIDKARQRQPPGGTWQTLDPVSQGRVQILPAGETAITQTIAVMTELERLATLASTWRWDQVAIIARQWQWLDPIRCYAELKGIPVQLGNRDSPPLWRLRETQALAQWVKTENPDTITAAKLEQWLAGRPEGRWWSLLREALEQYCLEVGEAELPPRHLIEWLVDWGREVRRKQQGLLLVTAHRAKGLEFEHVAVLDGGWAHRGSGADEEAERRVYYVAMTRARSTLTLSCLDTGNRFIAGLADGPALLRRDRNASGEPPEELQWRYAPLTLKDVDLSSAGRMPANHPIHGWIASLAPGSPLRLDTTNLPWRLCDEAGNCVGKLAKSYAPPAGLRCIKVRVDAVIVRMRTDSAPGYQSSLRCDRWEIVLPEIVFAP